MSIESLALAIQAGAPVILWGDPGIGKSKTIEAIGKALNKRVEVVIASIRDPSDFSGLPYISGAEVKREADGWAHRLVADDGGILFLDELSTAPPATQNALLRVVLERVVGDVKLPDNVSIVAAANPPNQITGGWELTAPLANRFIHLQWESNPISWVEGMISGWPTPKIPILPKDWRKHIPAAEGMVASYIRVHPTELQHVPKEECESGKAWPSGRSWKEMAAVSMAACAAAGVNGNTEADLVSGSIGLSHAVPFFAWRKEQDLPDPEVLLAKPESWDPPDRGDLLFTTLISVLSAVRSNNTIARWNSAWKVVDRAAGDHPDIAATTALGLSKIRPNGAPAPKEVRRFEALLREAGKL